jgi:hypothetical protein
MEEEDADEESTRIQDLTHETRNPKPEIRNPKLDTSDSGTKTQNLKPKFRNPKPKTRDTHPGARHLKPAIQDPKPETCKWGDKEMKKEEVQE